MILDNQKASKNSFQSTTFKDEENSRTFQGLAQKFKDLSRKNGIQGLFKNFPKIQGLFKDLHRNLRTFQGKMEFKDFSRTSLKFKDFSRTCTEI